MGAVLAVLVCGLLAVGFARLFLRRAIVFEFERGLLFRNGVLKRTLQPGRYWYCPFRTTIQRVDIRLRTIAVPSQEVLSADNVTVKITLAAQYLVSDPATAVTKVEKYQDAFYMALQLALRALVGGAKIDELIAGRQDVGKRLFEQTEAKVKDYGLTLKAVDVKDIMFPGDLKKIFAQIVKAQKEGLAGLEKARAETAVLRHLANAARLLEGNPHLMQLRTLQALEAGTGNTVVLGWPSQGVPVPVRNGEQVSGSPPRKSEPADGC